MHCILRHHRPILDFTFIKLYIIDCTISFDSISRLIGLLMFCNLKVILLYILFYFIFILSVPVLFDVYYRFILFFYILLYTGLLFYFMFSIILFYFYSNLMYLRWVNLIY